MAEKVIFYDLTGSPVFDPESTDLWATGISWSTYWPKGYGECQFKIRRGDIMADWVIKESYGVKIFDGATVVYQGRIESMPRSLGGLDEYITVNCAGWWCVFEERLIHKWWWDIKGVSRLRWPDGLETNATQTTFVNNKREGMILQVFLGTGDIKRYEGQMYRERCDLPAGTVRRVTFNHTTRSGENFYLQIYNVTTGAVEWQRRTEGTVYIAQATVTFAGATPSFEFRWVINNTDLHDQNDYGHVSNLTIESNYETGHPQIASPTYAQGELIKDIVLLVNQAGAQISTDFALVQEPGYILSPFTLDKPTLSGRVVEQIANYGDSQQRTWGACVWDDSDTLDGKPRFVFEPRLPVTDWEYEVDVNTDVLAGLTYELVSEELVNNAIVTFTNARNEVVFRDSSDNAGLADSTSIANEYRRDQLIELGQADTTRADYFGTRYVQLHKDRQIRGIIPVQGFIRKKGGGILPANQVRAGTRVKLMNTGDVFFIRYTSYDAESQTVQISPDQRENTTATMLVQRERKFGPLG
jgi:hypothetical protein